MRAEILYIDACPSWQPARERLRAALDDLGRHDVPIALTLLESAEQASGQPFAGSPTILINGEDLFPVEGDVDELACRLYPGSDAPSGAPTEAAIRQALRDRRASRQVTCSCCGRQRSRDQVHALNGGAYICRRCGLWVAARLRSDES